MNASARFARTVVILGEVFDRPTTDVLIEAYWDALRSWPMDALEGGARELIREGRFFPRPVEWADAAESWLRARQAVAASKHLRLAQSTEPALSADRVHALIDQLGTKLGWPQS